MKLCPVCCCCDELNECVTLYSDITHSCVPLINAGDTVNLSNTDDCNASSALSVMFMASHHQSFSLTSRVFVYVTAMVMNPNCSKNSPERTKFVPASYLAERGCQRFLVCLRFISATKKLLKLHKKNNTHATTKATTFIEIVS